MPAVRFRGGYCTLRKLRKISPIGWFVLQIGGPITTYSFWIGGKNVGNGPFHPLSLLVLSWLFQFKRNSTWKTNCTVISGNSEEDQICQWMETCRDVTAEYWCVSSKWLNQLLEMDHPKAGHLRPEKVTKNLHKEVTKWSCGLSIKSRTTNALNETCLLVYLYLPTKMLGLVHFLWEKRGLKSGTSSFLFPVQTQHASNLLP